MVSNRVQVIAAGIAIAALASAVGVGLVLRLADPLSSPVVPAEDPYTHMALVREHLRTGHLDGMYKGGLLYPPGLHAWIATWWSFTGMDLYEIFRLGPALFGAIGVLGVGILLWRSQGPAAAVVGAVAAAVAPEIIFRTTMMSPTALDLALLPFLFLAILQMLRGRLGWTAVAGALALFTMFSHPWLLAILAAAGLVFALLWLALPWDAPRPALSLPGLAATIAVIGVSLGLAFTTCMGDCGPGFQDVLPINAATGNLIATLLIAASLAPAALLVVGPPGLRARKGLPRNSPPWIVKAGAAATLVAILAYTTYHAFQIGIPNLVNLPRMFGIPILVFAFAAIVLLPFIASPISHLSAALFAVTYPMVIFNPMHSEFWPHRTAVYLGFGLVVLTGCTAQAAVRGAAVLYAAARVWLAGRKSRHRTAEVQPILAAHHARPAFGILAVAMLATLAMAGTVYAKTPDGYPGGWYRMYQPCEMDALRQVAARANAQPDAVVMVGDWEGKLVIASFTSDISRVWIDGGVFHGDHTQRAIEKLTASGHTVIVVVDRYLTVETPDADAAFLDAPQWHQFVSSCTNVASGQPRVLAYELQVT